MINLQAQRSAEPASRTEHDRRDSDTSVDFKKHLDAAKPKTPAKPAGRDKPAQERSSDTGDDAQTQAAQVSQPAMQVPPSFTDLGAAITRALAALKQTDGGADAVAAVGATTAQPSAIADSIEQIGAQVTDAALTPLEQAVHDIMAALPQPKPDDEHADDDTPSDVADRANDAAFLQAAPADVAAPPPPRDAQAPRPSVAPAPVAEPRQTELPIAQSHMHLVVGEGDDRVVLTVAVRGQDVNVSLRGGDEQTAANLARNAASLDHAMRAHGLDLDQFTSERDLDHHQRRDRPPRDAEHDESSEPFSIEESP